MRLSYINYCSTLKLSYMRQERHLDSKLLKVAGVIIKCIQCLLLSAVRKNEVTSVPIFFLNVTTVRLVISGSFIRCSEEVSSSLTLLLSYFNSYIVIPVVRVF